MRVKHVKVSAVKNKYYIKNTAAAGEKVYNNRFMVRLCIYFVYTARGDQVKYNSLFDKREGWDTTQ